MMTGSTLEGLGHSFLTEQMNVLIHRLERRILLQWVKVSRIGSLNPSHVRSCI
jgi:hypothetical protein